ncbi:MAG: S41 family peptidase [Candidatus Neomarinimicrobiota bacterium]
MKKSIVIPSFYKWLSGVFVLIMLLAVLTPLLYSKQKNVYSSIESKFKIMNQILYYVNQLYYEEVDMDSLMEGAFTGIMDQLDPHSIYIRAKEQENIEEMFRGEFQGIGIEFDILHNYITVISPVAGGPSERAGLLPGDQITAIDGRDAKNISRDDVFKYLRGAKGTRVDLKINRLGSEPFEVTIIRDNIPIYSVRASIMLDENTGYIWLTRFSAKSGQEVRQALDKLLAQGMDQLVLDLRNNSGGILEQAADVSNIFISHRDTLVYTKGKSRDTEQIFMANPRKGNEDFAVIILINRGSASASEIVAGAIQDLDRGLILGETSFGKGLVQRQITLEDGSALRVTIARYYTPSGRLIQRPFTNGNYEDYYQGLHDSNREEKIDSLQESRPKFSTRAGRPVYGGGGITPDKHIPWSLRIGAETRSLMVHPKRPLFNWGTTYNLNHDLPALDYHKFLSEWKLNESDFREFLQYVIAEGIETDTSVLILDKDYLSTILKSEIAGNYWGKDELWGVRLQADSQALKALDYFKEAGAFLIE